MEDIPLEVSDILVDLDDTISPFNGKDYFWDGLIQMLIEKYEATSRDVISRIDAIVEKEPALGDPNNIYTLAAKFEIDPDDLWTRAMLYLEKNSFTYPDSVRMVKSLHERGFNMHLATNRFGLWLDSRLAAAGLAGRNGSKYFRNYFDSKHGFGCKLDGDYYSKILAALAVAPERVLMIGDSLEQDLYNANKAGIRNVLIIDRSQKKEIVKTDAIYVNSLDLVSRLVILPRSENK